MDLGLWRLNLASGTLCGPVLQEMSILEKRQSTKNKPLSLESPDWQERSHVEEYSKAEKAFSGLL